MGNKIDCTPEERQVSKKEGEELAARYGLKHVETSAKENTNIMELFSTLAHQMKEKLKVGDKEENKNTLKLESDIRGNAGEPNKKCC